MDHRMEQEQVIEAEILGDNSDHFDTMMKQLLSSDYELRYVAERRFKICKRVDPGTLSLKLARLLTEPGGTDHARAIAAILLSNILMCERSNRWSQLEYLTLSKLKTIRLSLQNLLTLDGSDLWPQLGDLTQSNLKTRDGSDLWPQLGDLTQSNLKTILFSPFQGEGMILTHFMSSSNELHYMAETHFNICKEIDPVALFLNLALLLTAPRGTGHARAMSAILLRNLLFTRDVYLPWPRCDHVLWPRLDDSTQSILKTILLSPFQDEKLESISKQLCDTVSMLASEILPDNEFISIMFHCVSSDSPKLQESALLFFAQLSQYNGERLVPHIEHLHGKFLQCLTSSSNLNVKLAALNAVINFIQCLPSSADPDHFQNLLPEMWKTLTEALYNSSDLLKAELMKAKKMVASLAKELKELAKMLDSIVLWKQQELDASVRKHLEATVEKLLVASVAKEVEFLVAKEVEALVAKEQEALVAKVQEALVLLIELAGTKPKFLRPQLVEVVELMLRIAKDDALKEGTRHLVIKFVITLAEAREPVPISMMSSLFAILMNMLLDIEDNPAWNIAKVQYEYKDEDEGSDEDEDEGSDEDNDEVDDRYMYKCKYMYQFKDFCEYEEENLYRYEDEDEDEDEDSYKYKDWFLMLYKHKYEDSDKYKYKDWFLTLYKCKYLKFNTDYYNYKYCYKYKYKYEYKDKGEDEDEDEDEYGYLYKYKYEYQDQDEEKDEDEGTNYSVALDCLSWLVSLEGNTIFPMVLQQLLREYLAAPEWQRRHAALIALVQFKEVMIDDVNQVVAMVKSSFDYPHPRVRCAAINAIGQLCTKWFLLLPCETLGFQNPKVQVIIDNMNQVVAMVKRSFDDTHPRVRCAAINALEQFCTKWCQLFPCQILDFQNPIVQVMIDNMNQVVEMVKGSSDDPHPHVRCAAINAIRQFCTKWCQLFPCETPDFQNPIVQVMIDNMNQVVPMVKKYFDDPHPGVRCAAINALEQFCTRLCEILPFKTLAPADFQNPKVQAMIQKLDQVVEMVRNDFNDPRPPVRSAAIDAIGQWGPVLTFQYHGQMIPALAAAALVDFQNPGVQDSSIDSQVMIENLYQVVALVLESFDNPHLRVRWAAFKVLGELAPFFKFCYRQQISPIHAAAMDDFQNLRVQVLRKTANHVVEMVKKSLDDPHPCVRWAALNAITQWDHVLYFQHYGQWMSAGNAAMGDFQDPEVQVMMTNFCRVMVIVSESFEVHNHYQRPADFKVFWNTRPHFEYDYRDSMNPALAVMEDSLNLSTS